MVRTLLSSTFILLFALRFASGTPADFYFTERYQGTSLTGELIGLDVDAAGNANNVDPKQVLLFSVPPNVGITASSANPYVFVPKTFLQYHEDPFTHIVTLDSTTVPGIYGFNLRSGNILMAPLDLALVDASNKVYLFFNSDSFPTAPGSAGEYGITADGEIDYYWPTVNSFLSFTPASPIVSAPEPASWTTIVLAIAAAVLLSRYRSSRRGEQRAANGRACLALEPR